MKALSMPHRRKFGRLRWAGPVAVVALAGSVLGGVPVSRATAALPVVSQATDPQLASTAKKLTIGAVGHAWASGKSRGDRNANAAAACRDIFAANPNVTSVLGTAATPGDLNGWAYAKDLTRADRLKVTGKDDVALCWVDGDLVEEGVAGERALFLVEVGVEPVLLGIGSKLDLAYSSPRYKNVKAPVVPPAMADDIILPEVSYGPAEKAIEAKLRTDKPPVTIPDENAKANVPFVDAPANVPRRKLADLEKEVAVANKARRAAALATTTTAAPTTTLAPTTTGTTIAPIPTTTTPQAGGSKTVEIPIGSTNTVNIVSRNGRLVADGFETDLDLAVTADDPALVRVGPAGKRVSFGAPDVNGLTANGAARKAAKTAGTLDVTKKNQVRYVGGLGDGVDMTYEAFGDFIKESVILAAKPAGQVDLRFPLTVDGVTPRAGKDSSWEFVTSAGVVAYRIPAAFAFDSRGGAGTPGNGYVNLTSELTATATGFDLVVHVPRAWLSSPDRVYPVTIDPTVTLQPWNPMNLGYMPWGDNSGGSSFSAWTNDMLFGNWWGSQWRSYIQFDPALFTGRQVTQATVTLYVTACDNQSNPAAPYANPIYVRQLTSGYWFGQTWPGPSSTGQASGTPTGGGQYVNIDITAMAVAWAANPATNVGLQLDMDTAAGYCRVQRTGAGGQQTKITLTYDDPAPTTTTTTTAAPTTTAPPTTAPPTTTPPPVTVPPVIVLPVVTAVNTGPGWTNLAPTPASVFTMHPMSAGQSHIQSQPNSETSRCMAVMPWNFNALANGQLPPVNQWPCAQPFSGTGASWKEWSIEPNPYWAGSYWIRNVGTGYCLDVAWASQSAGASVVAYPCHNGSNQAFNRFDIGNGVQAWQALHSGQCLDLDGWGVAYWAGLTQWPCHLGPSDLRNQTFTVHGDNASGNFMVAGYVDSFVAQTAGVSISGWALTPQAPGEPLGIRTVVDGVVAAPMNGFHYYGFGDVGNASRPDVDAYWGGGYSSVQGFSIYDPVIVGAGTHTVCVQAQSYGYYDTLGCTTVNPGAPTGAHLLTDGVPTILERHSDLACVSWDANSARYSVSSNHDLCVGFEPELRPGGYWLHPVNPGDQGDTLYTTCLGESATGAITNTSCDNSTVISDLPISADGISFPIRFVGSGVGGSGVCLQLTSVATTAVCNPADLNQLFYDKVTSSNFVAPTWSGGGYNRTAAVNFANSYAYNLPASGWTGAGGVGYSYPGGGSNDCTNFASMILLQGGLSENSNWGHGLRTKWSWGIPPTVSQNGTDAWGQVRWNYEWVTWNRPGQLGIGDVVASESSLQAGDFVYFTWNSDHIKHVTHLSIVIGRTSSGSVLLKHHNVGSTMEPATGDVTVATVLARAVTQGKTPVKVTYVHIR